MNYPLRSGAARHFRHPLRYLKLRLLATVEAVIVLGPVSGSFSWQPQMVLLNYRATPPNPHAAALHHAITVGNGIIPHSVMKACTENQRSVGFHYPTPVLQCSWTSECSSIQSWGLFVIYFCINMIWLVSTENVQEEDFFRKRSREPLILRATTDVWVKHTVAANLAALMANWQTSSLLFKTLVISINQIHEWPSVYK